MKITLAFLVLGVVMVVALAAGEENKLQLSLDNDDDVEIAAKEDFDDEEKSKDDDDVTGMERSAAEIEDDDEEKSAGDVVEDRDCGGRKQKRTSGCRNKARSDVRNGVRERLETLADHNSVYVFQILTGVKL